MNFMCKSCCDLKEAILEDIPDGPLREKALTHLTWLEAIVTRLSSHLPPLPEDSVTERKATKAAALRQAKAMEAAEKLAKAKETPLPPKKPKSFRKPKDAENKNSV